MKWMEDKADGLQEKKTPGPCVSHSPGSHSTVSPQALLCSLVIAAWSITAYLSPVEKHPTRALQPKTFCVPLPPFQLAVSQPGPLLPAPGVAGLLLGVWGSLTLPSHL